MSEIAAKALHTYSPQSDDAYIRLAPEGTRICRQQEVMRGMVLDLDSEGRLVGIELLDVGQITAGGSALLAPGQGPGQGAVTCETLPDDAPAWDGLPQRSEVSGWHRLCKDGAEQVFRWSPPDDLYGRTGGWMTQAECAAQALREALGGMFADDAGTAHRPPEHMVLQGYSYLAAGYPAF